METTYAHTDLTRDEVNGWPAGAVLEFGANWCGHCQAAQPSIAEVLAPHSQLRHVKVEDGPGRRLGRSFSVKLWPTLIFLKDGVEVARAVRPQSVADIQSGLKLVNE